MTEDTKPTPAEAIDPAALDSLSVAPGDPEEAEHIHHPRQNAGQDASIAERLERDPLSTEARLDAGLDESMDASDPPAATQPGTNDPAPSSGYDAEVESALEAAKK